MLPGATKKPNSFSTQTHNLNERTLLHLWLSSARTKLHIYTKSVVGLCSSNVHYSFISLVSLDKQIFLCITEIIKVLQKNVLNWHYVHFWPWSTSSLPLLQAMEEFISSSFFLSDYLSSNGTAVHWYFLVKYLYLSNTTNTYNQKHLLFHVAENHKYVWKRNRHTCETFKNNANKNLTAVKGYYLQTLCRTAWIGLGFQMCVTQFYLQAVPSRSEQQQQLSEYLTFVKNE